MLKGFLRVVSRAVTLQLEEAAAQHRSAAARASLLKSDHAWNENSPSSRSERHAESAEVPRRELNGQDLGVAVKTAEEAASIQEERSPTQQPRPEVRPADLTSSRHEEKNQEKASRVKVDVDVRANEAAAPYQSRTGYQLSSAYKKAAQGAVSSTFEKPKRYSGSQLEPLENHRKGYGEAENVRNETRQATDPDLRKPSVSETPVKERPSSSISPANDESTASQKTPDPVLSNAASLTPDNSKGDRSPHSAIIEPHPNGQLQEEKQPSGKRHDDSKGRGQPPSEKRNPLAEEDDSKQAWDRLTPEILVLAALALFAGMSMGAASEFVRRSTVGSSDGSNSSVFMSEANIRRLVEKLSKMRGAALKLGQFMSIQDTNALPEQLERVLQQVQAHADYMPEWQLNRVMTAELGSDWESRFKSFEKVPMAAASIGQVHRATLPDGTAVAVKVQFPGIHDSIVSDLNNMALLLRTSALLPRGLYLDNTLKVFRGELADECDYIKEANSGKRFRALLAGDKLFEVPKVFDDLCTGQVLTTEMMSGKPLSRIKDLTQSQRDMLGTAVLRLCLLELFQFRLMQTDPNWANFLFDRGREKLQLIDFGATREYTVEFMDKWYRLLNSVMEGNRDDMTRFSQDVGYLTGEENQEMLEAHLRSMELLATPFLSETYDFASQSVTDEVRELIPVMLKYRLKPPPNETYSLNRKLSGSFLMCAKLGSRVNCRALWQEIVGGYRTST